MAQSIASGGRRQGLQGRRWIPCPTLSSAAGGQAGGACVRTPEASEEAAIAGAAGGQLGTQGCARRDRQHASRVHAQHAPRVVHHKRRHLERMDYRLNGVCIMAFRLE